MGAWGGRLFQSDQDLDILCYLSEETGVELYLAGCTKPGSEDGDKAGIKPKSIEETRDHLNAGALTRVFDKYKNKKHTDMLVGGNYYCVLLAAAGMQVGAAISKEQKDYLNKNYKKAGLYKEGIEQMARALKEYDDGVPWDFESKGLIETMKSGTSSAEPQSSNGEEIVMLNYLGDRYYEEGVGTPDLAKVMMDAMRNNPSMNPFASMRKENKRPTTGRTNDPAKARVCGGCGKSESGLEDGKKLKPCARCKDSLYCDRECQKKDWKAHKKQCGLSEKTATGA